ncbi:MAG: 2'-5' RNA ligase family protein [Lachnospiraceae bacterium]|nr:2'-5' RNA ligase family protein [Lachnospiraceae bacterium]
MYLITAYFDDNTMKELQHIIDEIATVSGNDFMIKNSVVPHLTISAFDEKSSEKALELFDKIEDKLHYDEILIPSVGVFLPYVIYAQPTKNKYLTKLSDDIYDVLSKGHDTRVNRYYIPPDWIPHITLGKKLGSEELQQAFKVVQNSFQPINAHITSFGLSKPNPLTNLRTIGKSFKNDKN